MNQNILQLGAEVSNNLEDLLEESPMLSKRSQLRGKGIKEAELYFQEKEGWRQDIIISLYDFLFQMY